VETDNEIVPKPIRVLVVDDHPAVRQGLAFLLEPKGILVCADAGTCADARVAVEKYHPDMAVVDLSLGDEDGISLIADLGGRALPSLAYSIHEDERHVSKALEAGAYGYVTKCEAPRVLVQAILEVAAGRHFISPAASMALKGQVPDYNQHIKQETDGYDRLDVEEKKHTGNGRA